MITSPAPPAAARGIRPSAAVRRARLAALGVGGFLLPWCVLLLVTLPASAHVAHWALAWAGLDGAEAAAALATAVLLARGCCHSPINSNPINKGRRAGRLVPSQSARRPSNRRLADREAVSQSRPTG